MLWHNSLVICDPRKDSFLAGLFGFVAVSITGCGGSDDDGATVALDPNCGSRWCSSTWSKSYSGSLSPSGFDSIVASCPKGTNDFYDPRATRIEGKYEWYCASRARYFEAPPRSRPLGLIGYRLARNALRSIDDVPWPPNAFQQFVSFEHDFYPLANGQCYVDFADMKVGGGVFRNGLAQEETMMLQLPELLLVVRERKEKQALYLSTPGDLNHNSDVIAFTDVLRPVSAIPKDIAMTCGRSPKSAWPCTNFVAQERSGSGIVSAIIAVNADDFQDDGFYNVVEFDFFASKVLAAFGAAQNAGCRTLNSGALGAGVFNGNVHLAIMLHAVMAVGFNVPVTMWGVRRSHAVDQVVAVLDNSPTIQTVLSVLRNDISWGHGRKNKDIVKV